MNYLFLNKPWLFIGDEPDYDVLSAELWAAEARVQLREMMVMKNLCHTDYKDEFASYGDLVKIDKPGTLEWDRMRRTDSINKQEGTASTVQVPMDQLFDTSFIVYDVDQQMAFKDLVKYRMVPALQSLVTGIESCVVGQVARFFDKANGQLGVAMTYDNLVDLRTEFSDRNIPYGDRHIVMAPKMQGDILKMDELALNTAFSGATQALNEARVGSALGFNFWETQMIAQIPAGNTTSTGAMAETGEVGETVLTVDGITGAIADGTWCTIAGDLVPHIVTAASETGADTTQITIKPGLMHATLNDAVITFYTPGTVDGAHAAGWVRGIAIADFTVAPRKGHMVNFGNATDVYTITKVDSAGKIWLDRPLRVALVNDQAVCISPAGSYNLAFQRNAIALVNRPLKTVAGVNQAVRSTPEEQFAIRATIGYDQVVKATVVSLDTLFGVSILEEDQVFALYR